MTNAALAGFVAENSGAPSGRRIDFLLVPRTVAVQAAGTVPAVAAQATRLRRHSLLSVLHTP